MAVLPDPRGIPQVAPSLLDGAAVFVKFASKPRYAEHMRDLSA